MTKHYITQNDFCTSTLQIFLILQLIHDLVMKHAKQVPYLHVSVFFDLLNMQKSETQIIYLWPLPREHWCEIR